MHVAIQYDLTESDVALIGQQWRSLLADSGRQHFFLSWEWQAAMLHIGLPHLACVRFYLDEARQDLVGMAWLGQQCKRYWGVATQYGYLNQTGHTALDQQWIEYNDVLSLPAHAQQCRRALVATVARDAQVDIVVIRSALADTFISSSENCSHTSLPDTNAVFFCEQERVPAYKTQLPQLAVDKLHTADALNAVLAMYSSNTRSQIRRAIKYIEATYGSIAMTRLAGQDIFSDYSEIQSLHSQRWSVSEYGSGFDNPAFNAFHRYLIQQAGCEEPSAGNEPSAANNKVEVLKFSTPTLDLGYLYNFVCEGHVYFYVSAINYADANNKFKVGLVMHALAQAHYAQHDCHTYDFMGGECRYKASLSTHQYAFYHTYLHCNPLKQQLYRSAKRVKALLF